MAARPSELTLSRKRRTTSCRLHHVTARGNDRQSIYDDATDRERFYDILAGSLGGSSVECHQDVQMGNHYHLVLEGAITDISTVLWEVNSSYARSYNTRNGRSGHVFERRFHCTPIPDLACAQAVAVYVGLNPVRAGLAECPSDWRYGSFRAQVGLEPPRPHLSTGFMERIFGDNCTLAVACATARATDGQGRPSLGRLLPRRSELTRLHVQHVICIFGYSIDDIARHYQVSVRTINRWLAASDAG